MTAGVFGCIAILIFFSLHLDEPPPRVREKGLAPVMAESSCCIAASYEAKAFGVMAGGSKEDLLGTLKPAQVMGQAAWSSQYSLKKPGVYIFDLGQNFAGLIRLPQLRQLSAKAA